MAVIVDSLIGLSCVFSFVGHAASEVFINESRSSMPTRLNNLAVPTLNFTAGGIVADIDSSLLDIPENESLWIGYGQVFVQFFYRGCSQITDVEFILSQNIQADLGQCYTYCRGMGNSSNIGLSGSTCICIDTIDLESEFWGTGCDRSCTHQTEAKCGDINHVAIYEPENVSNTRNTDDPLLHCLAVKRFWKRNGELGKRRSWSSCNQTYNYLCKEDDDDEIKSKKNIASWKETMQLCAKDKHVPVKINPWPNGFPYDTKIYWSGHIRGYRIVTYNEITRNAIIQKGYIRKYNGSLVVKFTFENETFPALCIRDASKSTTAVHSSLSPTGITPSEGKTTDTPTSTTALHSPMSPTEITSSVWTTTVSGTTIETGENGAESLERKTTKRSSNTMIAVYVAVPLALLIAVLVVAVYFWRRRGNGNGKEETSAYYSGTEKGPNVTDTAIVNPSYQEDHIIGSKPKAIPKDDTQNDYFVLEPANEYAAIDDVDLEKADDTEYDTTNAFGILKDSGNVYSRMNDVSDDTYNHTNIASRNEEEDAYDHTGHNDGNSMYNTTGTLPNNDSYVSDNEYNQTDQSCDTYNHLGSSISRIDGIADGGNAYNKMDNTMRDPRQVADAYSYAAPATKKHAPSPDQNDQPYNYAYATPSNSDVTAQRPVVFSLDKLPNTDNYEMAKDIPTNGDYELAKQPGI